MKKGPIRKPHALHEHAWWYEEKRGILVVQEARQPDGAYLGTVQVRIPWKGIVSAAVRCGALSGHEEPKETKP